MSPADEAHPRPIDRKFDWRALRVLRRAANCLAKVAVRSNGFRKKLQRVVLERQRQKLDVDFCILRNICAPCKAFCFSLGPLRACAPFHVGYKPTPAAPPVHASPLANGNLSMRVVPTQPSECDDPNHRFKHLVRAVGARIEPAHQIGALCLEERKYLCIRNQ